MSDIRWIEAPVCFVFHYLNAWNEGTQVTFDAIDFAVAPGFLIQGNLPGHAERRVASRWQLDVSTGRIDRELIVDVSAEFPRIGIPGCRWIVTVMDFWRPHLQRQRGRRRTLSRSYSASIWRPVSNKPWDAGFGSGVSEPVL